MLPQNISSHKHAHNPELQNLTISMFQVHTKVPPFRLFLKSNQIVTKISLLYRFSPEALGVEAKHGLLFWLFQALKWSLRQIATLSYSCSNDFFSYCAFQNAAFHYSKICFNCQVKRCRDSYCLVFSKWRSPII